MTVSRATGWISASLSDTGNVRDHNEDACLEAPETGVWLVADGMGGHDAGDYASQLIVESVARVQPSPRVGVLVDAVAASLRDANSRLREEGERRGGGIVGSTVAVLVLHGRQAVCVWAGDSRVYRLRDGALKRLTVDHRWVEEYVARGLMTREQADQHPLGNEITRALGAEDTIELAFGMRERLPGDTYLLCSDGLHGEVSDTVIAQVLGSEPDPSAACARLVRLAKDHGARDNVTVVVVKAESAP